MTRHLEETERAMQERVQRLEAARLSLEEVSTCCAGHPFCFSASSSPLGDPPTNVPMRPEGLSKVA